MRCKPRKRCCEKNASSCCKEHVKSIFKAVRRMWGKEMTGWQTSQHFCMRQGKCPGARLRGCALRRTRGRTRCSPTPMHPTHPSHPSLDPTLSITNSAWSITTTAQAKSAMAAPCNTGATTRRWRPGRPRRSVMVSPVLHETLAFRCVRPFGPFMVCVLLVAAPHAKLLPVLTCPSFVGARRARYRHSC